MLLNYLKLAIRLLLRNHFVTIINVLGLSVGFAAFYILWPYAQSELKTDQFHKDFDRIARLSRHYTYTEGPITREVTLPVHNTGLARKFSREYEEITDLTLIIHQLQFETFINGFDKDVFVSVVREPDMKEFYREHTVAFADPNFFRFFSFSLVSGNAEHILAAPHTVALSEKNAKKYFGDADPLNKTIYLNDSIPLKVTGVFKDLPRNTHLVLDVLMSTAGIDQVNETDWTSNWWSYAYIKVRDASDFATLEKKINDKKEKIYGICPRCPAESSTSVFVQPLRDVVFANMRDNPFIHKSEYFLTILSFLSFAIIILAWINYVCLSLHMLQKRIPELGTRKAIGAGGRDFTLQFVVEASIINFLALLVAMTFIQVAKSPMEKWLKFYTPGWNDSSPSTIWILVLMLGCGIAATSVYPILLSWRRRSIRLLRKSRGGTNPSWINAIVVGQYATAIALVIWIFAVFLQLDLILSRPLGIKKEGILVIDCPLEQKDGFETRLANFTNRLASIKGVHTTSVSKTAVGDNTSYGVPVQRNKSDIEWGLDTNGGVDERYLECYGINLLHGRNFQSDMPSDRSAILLSRKATVRLNFTTPEEALGAKLILPWSNRDDAEVIGVYDDYEFRPLLVGRFEKDRGSFLTYGNHLIPDFYPSKISVQIDLEGIHSNLDQIGQLYKEIFPQETFRWTFLDDNISRHYQNEKVARNQIVVFTFIAIAISCIGLLGMISNKIIEKTKEIGIRKVLGAGLLQIGKILLDTTSRQLLFAIPISISLAYYLSQQYLHKFVDRIELQWWHYAFPVALLLIIMFGTIASVVWKAANRNPVEALRYE